MTAALIGFGFAFGLIFLRVPIAIALGIVGLVGFSILNGFNPAMSRPRSARSGSWPG